MLRWLPRRRWIWAIGIAAAILTAFLARPIFYLARTALTDRDERAVLPAGTADDASRLNAAPVSAIWDMPSDAAKAERALADLLAKARRDSLKISIAGARHSMGGQTIYPHGIQINMLPYHRLQLDEEKNILSVQAGALWSDVLPYLDNRGRSIAVMQSNNSFSVGGSLSVNCHGWQANRPPIASTVESFRLMLADGSIVSCSRNKNAELFSLALGGYGLFGVILDVQLRVVPNVPCRLHQFVVPADQFVEAWEEHVAQSPDVEMALGRLSVSTDNFLKSAILYVFTRDKGTPSTLPSVSSATKEWLARVIFRMSVESEYGKDLRWSVERDLLSRIAGEHFTRNQLLNESAEMYANRSAGSTDILHEYFMPRDHFDEFLVQLRKIIPANGGNLLNVTLRDIREDHDSFLRYADRDMVALVMLFNEKIEGGSDAKMSEMTRQMIDAAIALGGRYYLPYRLHATPEQFRRAYPQSIRFFELKRQYDPDELFQNEFYLRYGRD